MRRRGKSWIPVERISIELSRSWRDVRSEVREEVSDVADEFVYGYDIVSW